MNKCIIFSAPSGAGKTTIVKHLLAEDFPLEFSISAATREKRNNEVDGKDYYFLSVEDFKKKIEKDEFIEWEEVYPDHFYGTLRVEIERIWAKNKTVIFDVDVVGGLNLKKYFGEGALAIFVMPPSIQALEERLNNRGTETQDRIEKRLAKAKQELITADQFDYVVLNDDLEKAIEGAKFVVNKFFKRMKIGLFFGTYNPVHVGHMVIANYMVEFTDLEQIWMVVTPHNPFKKKDSMLKDYDRLHLVQLAIGEDTRLKASNIEFDLPQPNYTVDTLVYLKEKYPDKNFSLIMGADNLNHFHKWKNHEVILEHHDLYVYPRMESNDGGELRQHFKVNYVEAPVMKISSSFIRKAIAEGKDVSHYMPSKVAEYVNEMNIYK